MSGFRGHDIWAVGKDPGGTRGVMSVVNALRERGHRVLMILSGKAAELGKTTWHDLFDWHHTLVADSVGMSDPYPRAFITDMSSNGGLGRDLVTDMREHGIPVIALQDYWGARMVPDEDGPQWSEERFRPDALCVNDQEGVEIGRRAWPDYDEANFRITGYPAMDRFAAITPEDVSAAKAEVYAKLGMHCGYPLIFFPGGGHHTAHALSQLARALREITLTTPAGVKMPPVYLHARPHPRTVQNFPEEAIPFQTALLAAQGLQPVNVVFDQFGQFAASADKLMMASDLIVGMFSTVLVEGAYLRKPSIAFLDPEHGGRRFQPGTYMPEFPLVPLGCTRPARNGHELVCALRDYLQAPENFAAMLRDQQERHFRTDGLSASRCANVVEELMNNHN